MSTTCHKCTASLKDKKPSTIRTCSKCQFSYHITDCGSRYKIGAAFGPVADLTACPKCSGSCGCAGGPVRCRTFEQRNKRRKVNKPPINVMCGSESSSSGKGKLDGDVELHGQDGLWLNGGENGHTDGSMETTMSRLLEALNQLRSRNQQLIAQNHQLTQYMAVLREENAWCFKTLAIWREHELQEVARSGDENTQYSRPVSLLLDALLLEKANNWSGRVAQHPQVTTCAGTSAGMVNIDLPVQSIHAQSNGNSNMPPNDNQDLIKFLSSVTAPPTSDASPLEQDYLGSNIIDRPSERSSSWSVAGLPNSSGDILIPDHGEMLLSGTIYSQGTTRVPQPAIQMSQARVSAPDAAVLHLDATPKFLVEEQQMKIIHHCHPTAAVTSSSTNTSLPISDYNIDPSDLSIQVQQSNRQVPVVESEVSLIPETFRAKLIGFMILNIIILSISLSVSGDAVRDQFATVKWDCSVIQWIVRYTVIGFPLTIGYTEILFCIHWACRKAYEGKHWFTDNGSVVSLDRIKNAFREHKERLEQVEKNKTSTPLVF
mmetsp:Transcript_9836/g.11361  ORF Transcript_9836/g.11361 Transcript_9836/m.11361 type:complete len:544 (+) Transcript_9836:331-1962(+)|eukprot:CAMPEP_0197850408 /NCGR_PEP_ID=MMETSP1438-20131217/15298_1 /TAXON_ID=1461541 /ORGANISM="Pterosperma sp., Strain CCMP1384" /LENGTH=543 /DNA_ID=CAMNT_0043463561 /DNA_START=331 /DNA_END=1962 /DNA_ORIENTATION=-